MSMERKTSTRGFASVEREKQREIARKGGRSVPHEKRSFSQNHQLAVEAGRKAATRPAVAPRLSALKLGETQT